MNTENIIRTLQTAVSSVQVGRAVELIKAATEGVITDNPLVVGLMALALVIGLLKRSRTILLFLFAVLSTGALVHYTLPVAGELDLASVSNFAIGWVLSTGVVVYFLVIK